MAETTETTKPAEKTKKAKLPIEESRKLRKKSRLAGRKKRTLKLRSDKEFAKQFFEGKSKRSTEKSSLFRKKKSSKK